jgi:hypothetical protein
MDGYPRLVSYSARYVQCLAKSASLERSRDQVRATLQVGISAPRLSDAV